MTEIPTFPPVKKSPPPLVIVIVASVLGGVLGTFVLFTLFPEYRLAEIPPGINSVVVERPGKVVIEEEDRVDDLRNQLSSNVGEIFSQKSIGTEPENSAWPAGQVQAYATILTSDGFFVTVDDGVAVGDYIRVKDKYFTVTEIEADPASNLVFGRGEISGLSVPSIANHKDLRSGMASIGIMADRGVFRTSIADLAENINEVRTYYLNSDSQDLVYTTVVSAPAPGLPYFNMSGNLIGIAPKSTVNSIIPAYTIQTALNSYISTGEITRHSANIQFISVPNQPGVKVYRRLSESAVDELQLDDIIIKVNGQDVTADPHSFYQIFQNLSPATEVPIVIVRDGETLDLTIKTSQL